MKKRRLAIACFVLAACLLMGMGYAALNKELEIDNYVALSVDPTDYNAVFTTASFVAGETSVDPNAMENTNYTVAVNAANAAVLDINLDANTLTEVGHKVTVTATIKNVSEYYNVNLQAPVVGVNDQIKDYVSVTCELAAGATDPLTPASTATCTTTCTIVVELKAMPTEAISRQNISITIPHSATTYTAAP